MNSPFYLIAAVSVILYCAIGGLCYCTLYNKVTDPDHEPPVTKDSVIIASVLWPILFLPYYLAASAEIKRALRLREKKEREDLLKKEGII